MNQIRICISGDVGSGKSSITKALQETLQVASYSTGAFQRQLAKEKGITTLELNQYAEKHPEVDFEIDQMSKDLSQGKESFILDSRLGWHFVNPSFKIFLTLNEEIAAKRIIADSQRGSEQYRDLPHAVEAVKKRKESEQKRYLELYKVDLRDFSNYDLVVNTSKKSIPEIADSILDIHKAWQLKKSFSARLFF